MGTDRLRYPPPAKVTPLLPCSSHSRTATATSDTARDPPNRPWVWSRLSAAATEEMGERAPGFCESARKSLRRR